MARAEDTEQPRPAADLPVAFAVRTSPIMELLWALMLHEGEPTADYPVRAGRFDQAPGMEDRIAGFWADGETCFTELFVVAERGGVLFARDAETMFRGLEAGAAAPARFEEFESESAEDKIRFRERIDRLREDPELRQGWLDLLRDVWSAVAPELEGDGGRAVARYACDLEARLKPGGRYADLEAEIRYDFRGMLPRLVAAYAATGREVTAVPAWYGRKCFVITLTDRLIVSVGAPPRPPGPSEATRSRARRLKAMGDPTRLAILEACWRPLTVGELADLMGVAQPTVSNHVRILRDAGLLDQVKDGQRRLLANAVAVGRLAEEMSLAVAPRT